MSIVRNGRLWLCLLLTAALLSCGPSVPPAPRNLLVIAIDTVRYDGFLDPEISDDFTAWIDRAQVYTNAIAPSSWTIPSVVSVFTGKYPIEHGAGRFEPEFANLATDLPSPLAPEAVTLAEILDRHYFRTGAFVSHPFFASDLGLEQGFQERHMQRGWRRDYARFREWADPIELPHRFYGYLHFMEAHHWHARDDETLAEFLAEYDEDVWEVLRQRSTRRACSEPDSRRCRQNMVYNAALLELRKGIASILDDFERRGLLDQTLVVLYSDHGEEFWDHEDVQLLKNEDPRGNPGLGHGQSMFQELLHIPLMIWHPEITGARHVERVSLVDVLPTLLAWLELEEPELEHSGELLPPLRRHWFRSPDERTVYSSGIAYGPEKVAVLDGQLKSVYTIRDDRFEFFDLERDPLEKSPLNEDGLIMRFEALTGDYLERRGIAMASRQLGAEQIAELKAIGYLQGVDSDASEVDNPAEKLKEPDPEE